MIIRIMGEGQLEVSDDHLEELNKLDEALETAVNSGDDSSFRATLEALLAAVRSYGTAVPDDTLVESDLVLPYADAHIDEVRAMLTGEGLIPG